MSPFRFVGKVNDAIHVMDPYSSCVALCDGNRLPGNRVTSTSCRADQRGGPRRRFAATNLCIQFVSIVHLIGMGIVTVISAVVMEFASVIEVLVHLGVALLLPLRF